MFNYRLIACFFLFSFFIIHSKGDVKMLTEKYNLSETKEVKVYYYIWNIFTRYRLSLSNIRELSDTQIVIRGEDNINSFITWARLSELKDVPNDELEIQGPIEPRLVIDLIKDNGEIITYYANNQYLYTADSKKKLPITDSFRDKFTFEGKFKLDK